MKSKWASYPFLDVPGTPAVITNFKVIDEFYTYSYSPAKIL